jgi:hypothetical protein
MTKKRIHKESELNGMPTRIFLLRGFHGGITSWRGKYVTVFTLDGRLAANKATLSLRDVPISEDHLT